MRKFVVTGAAGYIGRHVVKALIEQGHQVAAITRTPTSDSYLDGAVNVQADLWKLQIDQLSELTNGATFVHLAWQDGFNHASDTHMGLLSNHFDLTKRLIDAGVSKVVGLGTMHEIGPTAGVVTEQVQTNPQNQYGIAKNALRLSLEDLCARKAVDYLWLRCFYIMGDDVKNHSVFTKMLQLDSEGAESMPLTLGTTKFDFIDVVELGYSLALLAANDLATGLINLGSGTPVTLREKLEQFHTDNHLKIRLDFGAFPERQGISTGCWPDLNRLRRLVNL